jgi:hypothetical protein
VQFRTRAVRPRVDLAPLVEQLNNEEPTDGVSWAAGPVSGLTPVLSMAGDGAHESGIAPDRFVTLVEDHLRSAPPAWDPYRVTR